MIRALSRMTDNRPSNVRRFEQLMYLSIAIGVVNTVLDWNRLVTMAKHLGGAVFIVLVDGIVFGVLILLIWLVARQAKNWARWVQLGMFVVGIPSGIRLVEHNLHDRPVAGTLGLLSAVLQVAALFLIFTGNARDWFNRDPA